MAACIRASVPAPAFRPTGPAATPASAPSSNLSFSSPSTLSSFMSSRKKSVDDAPICGPTLPPPARRYTGLHHPTSLVCWLTTPRPPSPPTVNATLITRGNTAIALARETSSRGLALSGTGMMASNASAAFSDCSAASLICLSVESFARAETTTIAASATPTKSVCCFVGFMTVSPFLGKCGRHFLDRGGEHQQRPPVDDQVEPHREADEPRPR